MAKPEQEIGKIAGQIVAQTQTKVARLKKEILGLKEQLAKKEAQLDSANLAADRLSNFQVKLGGNYQCPRCWIEHGKHSAVRTIPSSSRDDAFRCDDCGFEFCVNADQH